MKLELNAEALSHLQHFRVFLILRKRPKLVSLCPSVEVFLKTCFLIKKKNFQNTTSVRFILLFKNVVVHFSWILLGQVKAAPKDCVCMTPESHLRCAFPLVTARCPVLTSPLCLVYPRVSSERPVSPAPADSAFRKPQSVL